MFRNFYLVNKSAEIIKLGLKTSVRSKHDKKFVDPRQLDSLPVFQYASANGKGPSAKVYVWGLAEHGALGDRQFIKPVKKERRPVQYMHRPYRLKFGEEHEVTNIAAGYGFTLFAVKSKDANKVFGCGLNSDSQIGYHCVRAGHPLELIVEPVPLSLPLHQFEKTKVLDISCGRAHSAILTDTDGVFTLGHNGYGQCGRSIINNEDYKNNKVIHQIHHGEDPFEKIVCGQDHTLFITKTGAVHSCGWGADGQTGQGHYNNSGKVSPVIGDVQGEKVVKVSSSADCVLALNDRGEVFGWGNSEYGQLSSVTNDMQANISKRLKLPSLIGRIRDIATTGTACMVLNDEGHVFVWGYGILGKGPQVDQSKEPTEIPSTLFGRNEFAPDTRVVSVYGGLSQWAAVTNNGDLYTWGKNRGGCLGLGHLNDQFFPIKVALPGRVTNVSIGVDHCVALCKPFA